MTSFLQRPVVRYGLILAAFRFASVAAYFSGWTTLILAIAPNGVDAFRAPESGFLVDFTISAALFWQDFVLHRSRLCFMYRFQWVLMMTVCACLLRDSRVVLTRTDGVCLRACADADSGGVQ